MYIQQKRTGKARHLRLCRDCQLWRYLYVRDVARGSERYPSCQRVVQHQHMLLTLSGRGRQLDGCHDTGTHCSELYLVILVLTGLIVDKDHLQQTDHTPRDGAIDLYLILTLVHNLLQELIARHADNEKNRHKETTIRWQGQVLSHHYYHHYCYSHIQSNAL